MLVVRFYYLESGRFSKSYMQNSEICASTDIMVDIMSLCLPTCVFQCPLIGRELSVLVGSCLILNNMPIF